MKRFIYGIALIILPLSQTFAQTSQLAPLTVEKIMRDPKWMGTSPSDISWSEDSRQIYFRWNPDKNKGDSLYVVAVKNLTPAKVTPELRRALPAQGLYNRARTEKVYEKNGDIYWMDIKRGITQQITHTVVTENNPVFSHDEKKVLFTREDNLFAWHMADGSMIQLTDFKTGKAKEDEKKAAPDQWLKADQLAFFEVLKERKQKKDSTEKLTKAEKPKAPKEIYLDDKTVYALGLSPDEKFITYRLAKAPKGAKSTIVPSYVTETGYTEDLPARTKVGTVQASYELYVYDIVKDTVFAVPTKDIPGIDDRPDFEKDYPQKAATKKDTSAAKKAYERDVLLHGPFWSEDGRHSVIIARSADNKDRWVLNFDIASRQLKLLDRQRDEAWVAGPGINGGWFNTGDLGWLGDNRTVWYQSEAEGYSHIYTADVITGAKKQLTQGKFEVSSLVISRDKKHFYFVANQVHPGEKHLYKIPVTGGKPVQLTSGSGAYEPYLSPNEKYIALRYSSTTKPWELFLMENKPGAKARQVTQSLTEEFKSYNWREPQVLTFKARDGAEVYARLYKPALAEAKGPAVIFVHGAGYLQNAHKYWSQYFREYMFHNLLVDNGYTVLDIDYRGSAGYGRDWRTGIYRFMGGKDLTDHIDGANFLVDKHGVDPSKIGIYGGSYGGFITLMAMFTQPGVFKAGAALRSVTDWAHYNHPYTSNILNEPHNDSLAYARSSPVYHAQGLKGHLLMCHGMLDVNVHFQDIVRLTQRLIELKKENWELAVYPMEDHAFTEPSSWTDEYKRIFKLFEEQLKGQHVGGKKLD
jgi:dipeptidyl aminopeptidase/acylaminoacyl peptidase